MAEPDKGVMSLLASLPARPPLQGALDVSALRASPPPIFEVFRANPPPIGRVEDVVIPGPFGDTKIRIYDSLAADELRPALIFFHGGGWVAGNLDSEDRALRELALASQCAIISVDYVLAPEYKFPRPFEDCLSAVRWVRQNGTQLGIDTGRVGIGGASAGANLALAVACAVASEQNEWLRFVLLHYGAYSRQCDSASHRQFGGGAYLLTSATMDAFWQLYLEHEDQAGDPRAAPLTGDLRHLPTTFVTAAGFDPLRDDSTELVSYLADAGVDFTYRLYASALHGFSIMFNASDLASLTARETGDALRKAMQ